MARRRQKLGLGRLACGAAAISAMSNGAYFKNPMTDSLRNMAAMVTKNTQGIYPAAVLVIGSQALAKELNKEGWNPSYGPFRAV